MKLFGVSLGEGNTKVGDVLTFSLPARITCPGASAWCLKHCYAYRYEVRRPGCRRAYESNLSLASDSEEFAKTMIGVLPRILPCFRLHVSGDFYSTQYIQTWVRICQAFPQILFWSYTRSWAVEELRDPLEQLRDRPNVQLFASTDPSMALPPRPWRRAFVETDSRAIGLPCGSQTQQKRSCLICGYCFRRGSGDVILKVR